MVYIHVRHRVADYARWREGFDKHVVARQAGGATGELYVLRNVDDPDEITVIVGWRNLAQARAFVQSNSLKEAMQHAGVTGQPSVRFLEAVD
jgi:heme-degrading monooxygenase HmoA